jgi:spermidine synthase
MTMKTGVPRFWFYLLFTVSGFAGLIYESIWSHYLKLFLGHAAYAQTLVLAIFMGGMAIGSWICSRYSIRWRNLLLGYAAAEAVIGLCALVFHRIFVAGTDLAYDFIMPGLGNPVAVNAFKWGLSALFILPQSILLGMTFPLMSAGLIRRYPDHSGGAIAMLYFTNSLGAAAGVLASGFLLIGLVGLPGTMLTAGLLNIVLALGVWALVKNMDFPAQAPAPTGAATRNPEGYVLMLAIALLTGAASFIYEIGWIRMLSMVLGSSTHAFELMLSAFILGLAFGGLWIKRRIDGIRNPERFLGIVQVVMGLLALLTLVVYGRTFELMQWMLAALGRTENGYVLFHTGSHMIALCVMFPAAFCAGMTLPLITHSLLRGVVGERAIGAVYAANTVGAIAGVFVAVHLGLPQLGLKGTISLGAAIDIGLGVLLLWKFAPVARERLSAATVGCAALVATLAWVELDSHKMASGVYRRGSLYSPDSAKILYHRDGKTATVNLVEASGRVSIHTNGKPDAAIRLDPDAEITIDEVTMVMTAALPLAFHPNAKSVANIGFGSGLTAHVLLASNQIRELDTIEIESAMVEGARGFSPRNDRVYRDPRSRIHTEDAKTFFSTHNKRYDIIVSEPSNPWVSGVASLFGEEFYQRAASHLAEDGLLVQWMQLYEINPLLVASVFKALARHFSDYVIYASYNYDIIIVAKKTGSLPQPSSTLFEQPALKHELERIRISNAADLQLHRVGARKAVHPYFESFAIAPNSDYFPVLDLNAAKARFLRQDAYDIVRLALTPIPAVELLEGSNSKKPSGISMAQRPWLTKATATLDALAMRDYLLEGRMDQLARLPSRLSGEALLTRLLGIECANGRLPEEALYVVAAASASFLQPEEARPVWQKMGQARCTSDHREANSAWIALFAAVSERDARRMAELGEIIFSKYRPTSPEMKRYALAAAMIGRLTMGQREAAESLWREFKGEFVNSDDMLPALLHSHFNHRN